MTKPELLLEELTPRYYFDDATSCPQPELLNHTGYVWELLSLKNRILENVKKNPEILGEIESGAKIIGPVHIGKGTLVHAGSVIKGPAWIGRRCSLRYHCLIRDNSVIGDSCIVGHSTEVKDSLILSGAKIQGLYAGNCIFGAHSRISSGCVLGNRKFDQSEIKVKLNNRIFGTGMKFFGCVLGDYSRLGTVTTTSPGTLIGKHTWIYGNQQIRGFVPSYRLVKYDSVIVKKDPVYLTTGFGAYEWV